MDKDIKVTLKVWRQKGPNLSYSTTTAVKVSAVCVHCM